MDDAMMLPAPDTSLAWVYEGATPAMTPGEAATAIQAATLLWTQDDHLQMGALQHHLAVGLGDDPERQAVCSAAAYMHVAAAGLDPGSLLNKGLDPKVLRPKLGTKPVQIGKTRSGKPIYNMFTHPAHASFSTADHVDHIDAMAAHRGSKKMEKAGGEGSRGGKVIGHTRSNKPIYASVHSDGKLGRYEKENFSVADHRDAHEIHAKHGVENFAESGRDPGHHETAHTHYAYAKIKESPVIGKTSSGKNVYRSGSPLRGKGFYNDFSAKDHQEAAAMHESALAEKKEKDANSAKAVKRFRASPVKVEHAVHAYEHKNAARRTENTEKSDRQEKSMYKSEAVSILEDFLAKSSASILGRTSSGKAVHPASHSAYSKVHTLKTMATGPKKRVGVHDAIQSTLRAHGGYNAKDHAEAGALHEKAGNIHLAEMHNMASGYLGAMKRAMSKSGGEGSRGGRVVAHTASGAPIYAAHGKTYRGMKAGPVIGSHNTGKEAYDERDRTHMINAEHVKAKYPKFTKEDHKNAAEFHEQDNNHHVAGAHHAAAGYFDQERFAHLHTKKSMRKSGIMGFPVDLGDMQGSPIDGSYVDSMGGSHDLFMQQAELANCPTMWAPIATVPEN